MPTLSVDFDSFSSYRYFAQIIPRTSEKFEAHGTYEFSNVSLPFRDHELEISYCVRYTVYYFLG